MTPVPACPVPHIQIDQIDEDTVRSASLQDSDADLLCGLGALADLISNASDTLNQCLLTIEGKLNAAAVAKEEWIPIRTARSAVEHVPASGEEQASQERVFGGVAVTIMKFGAPATPPERTPRCQWHYELGYAVANDEWTLMIRTASVDGSRARPEYSNVMPLRGAPLEIRLKAIREIPNLIQRLDSTITVGFDCGVLESALDAGTVRAEEAAHQATP